VLANPVIERFEIHVDGDATPAGVVK
jgi:phosphoribosylformylglycinamidine (FGAM) synthase PurS component